MINVSVLIGRRFPTNKLNTKGFTVQHGKRHSFDQIYTRATPYTSFVKKIDNYVRPRISQQPEKCFEKCHFCVDQKYEKKTN